MGRFGGNELARIGDHEGRSRARRRAGACDSRSRYHLNHSAALSCGRLGANLLHLN